MANLSPWRTRKDLRSVISSLAADGIILECHFGSINCISTSHNNKYAVTGSLDRTARLWDIDKKSQICIIEKELIDISSICISPDNKFIIYSSGISKSQKGSLIKVWELKTHTPIKFIQVALSRVNCIAITQDSQFLASGSEDSSITLWTLQCFHILHVFQGHTSAVTNLSVSPSCLISSSKDLSIKIWSLLTFELEQTVFHSEIVTESIISQRIYDTILWTCNKKVIIWDRTTQKIKLELLGHTYIISALTSAKNGELGFSMSRDCKVIIWDLFNFEPVQTLQLRQGCISLSCTTDGKTILSGCIYRIFHGFDISKNKEEDFFGHYFDVSCIDESVDCTIAASGSRDCSVRVWDLVRKKGMCVFLGHQQKVSCLKITPNKLRVVSGSLDKQIFIWNIAEALNSIWTSTFLQFR